MPKACSLPPHKARLMALPDNLVGCRFSVHGNSSARSAKGAKGRTALSFHRVRRSGKTPDNRTLFNLFAPAVFKDARLVIDQTRAKAAQTKLQVITWPTSRKCKDDAGCNVARKEVCKRPASGKPGKCASVRRVKTPFAYVEGDVHPDDGTVRARSIALFPGAWKDGVWVEAKYVDVKCPDFPANQAACPAVTEASTVRFVPNFADGESPQPFSTSLEGRRR